MDDWRIWAWMLSQEEQEHISDEDRKVLLFVFFAILGICFAALVFITM